MALGRSARTIADVGGRRRGATYGVIDNDRQNSAALTESALAFRITIPARAKPRATADRSRPTATPRRRRTTPPAAPAATT